MLYSMSSVEPHLQFNQFNFPRELDSLVLLTRLSFCLRDFIIQENQFISRGQRREKEQSVLVISSQDCSLSLLAVILVKLLLELLSAGINMLLKQLNVAIGYAE